MQGQDWTSRRPTAICLGLSAIDHIWQAERLPDAMLAKTRAVDFASRGGGMAATAAVALARLGAEVSFWGRGGEDAEGRLARDELAREGVGVDAYRLFQGARSSVSGIFVDPAGERHIVNFRGSGLPDEAGWLPREKVAAADAVLADPRWPEGAAMLFATAKDAGIARVLDGDVADRSVFDRLLPLTDHAIFSQPGLLGYAGATDEAALAAVAAAGCRVAAVTLGSDGVLWIENGKVGHMPALPVDIVDTTGAGDVFHGAYAFAIGAGAAAGDAIGFASAAAALKCRKAGGREGIADLEETIRFWRQHQ